MDDVRIGLAGCGLFGESHLCALRAIPGARVAAVYDPNGERAANCAGQFGVPLVCGSLEELCAVPVDAIDVVSPEDRHLEPVLAAVRAGRHVFVEKPLAMDLEHCECMIRAAREAGVFLMPGHLLRFETRFAMLKEEIGRGGLGRIVSMHGRRNRLKSLLQPYGRNHPVIENSVHDIDLMLWFMGDRVCRVRGFGRRATGGKHHDTFWGVLEFEGGALGVVETVWLLPPAGIALEDAFQVIGDRGVADINFVSAGLSLRRQTGYEVPDVSYDPRVQGSAHGALREELSYFCHCVREGRAPQIITAVDAKNAVRVSLALIESANRGVDIEIREWD